MADNNRGVAQAWNNYEATERLKRKPETLKDQSDWLQTTFDEYIGPENGRDATINPKHYKSHPSGTECIDVIEHLPANLAFAVKYIWRCDDKEGWQLNLSKAVWFLLRELYRRGKTGDGDDA